MDRAGILAEIRRTADANGGRALGIERFAAETGIREHEWKGRYWARWSDAVEEAGYSPNLFQTRGDDDALMARLAEEVRRLGRLPTEAELKLIRHRDPAFPSTRVFRRLGRKRDIAAKLHAFCAPQAELADVASLLAPLLDEAPENALRSGGDHQADEGFVYLLRSGRHYKIGRTNHAGRRQYELAIQLPEPVAEVHVIATDDPAGIERYWHDRFAERRRNGEWFELTAHDVAAFRKRRFM